MIDLFLWFFASLLSYCFLSLSIDELFIFNPTFYVLSYNYKC